MSFSSKRTRRIPAGFAVLTAVISASFSFLQSFIGFVRTPSVLQRRCHADRCTHSGHTRDTFRAHVARQGLDLNEMADANIRLEDLRVSAITEQLFREELGYLNMTEVQSQAIPAILEGADVVVKARKGTGKTLAYLIPVVERLVQQKQQAGNREGVGALILSPRDELAMQVADVARQLVSHQHGLGVQCIHGQSDVMQETELVDIIVATPEQLYEHMQNSEGFLDLFSSLQILVLDDADFLLDDFRKDILSILKRLPSLDARQGVVVSPTLAGDVLDLITLVLRPNHQLIDTVPAVKQGLELKELVGEESALRFEDLHISGKTKKALGEEMEFSDMTEVQVRAIPAILDRSDVVARSQTGSGKTLAYLIPVIEMLTRQRADRRDGVGALILSPTRELAMQISGVAEELLTYHEDLAVYCMHGQTDIKRETRVLQEELINIIVATPGRLNDHVQNSEGFVDLFSDMQVLVLDEADTMLNSFRDMVVSIFRRLPPPDARQGLMFSATFPSDLSEITALALKSNYQMIDTVRDEGVPASIQHSYAVLAPDQMVIALWYILQREYLRKSKVIVFFTTARVTQYYAALFRRAGIDILEIHSRRAQRLRTEAASTFWTAETGIIFSTDVTARGLDYPEVASVIHFGAPSSGDRYVHRMGRTGRMGKHGHSMVLLQDFEVHVLDDLKALAPLNHVDEQYLLKCPKLGLPAPDDLRTPLEQLRVGQAYKAWVGYYNYFFKEMGWPQEKLVEVAGHFAASIGALGEDGSHPPLRHKTAQKLGLSDVEGLNIVDHLGYVDHVRESRRKQRQLDSQMEPRQQRRIEPRRRRGSYDDELDGPSNSDEQDFFSPPRHDRHSYEQWEGDGRRQQRRLAPRTGSYDDELDVPSNGDAQDFSSPPRYDRPRQQRRFAPRRGSYDDELDGPGDGDAQYFSSPPRDDGYSHEQKEGNRRIINARMKKRKKRTTKTSSFYTDLQERERREGDARESTPRAQQHSNNNLGKSHAKAAKARLAAVEAVELRRKAMSNPEERLPA